MAPQDLCLATIVALLVVLALALARWAARRRAAHRRAAAAGARLLSDLRGMMDACEALAAIAPAAAGPCRQLGRGLAASAPAAPREPGARQLRALTALYRELSASSELAAAAAAYEKAAAAADGAALARALARCAGQLRAVVASVHRLGVALELE